MKGTAPTVWVLWTVVVALGYCVVAIWQHTLRSRVVVRVEELCREVVEVRGDASGAEELRELLVEWQELDGVCRWTAGGAVLLLTGLSVGAWRHGGRRERSDESRQDAGEPDAVAGRSGGGGAVADLRDEQAVLRLQNEELIRFTRAVSHDLRSPLVTIQTFLAYLGRDLEKGDGARVEADLGHIRAAAVKMEQMLEELLVLSRAGRAVVDVVDMDLGVVLREALEMVAGQVRGGGVDVRLPATGFVIRGERRRLVQLFQNLLDNAVKYKGGQVEPVVEIGVELGDGVGRVVVRDNGVGIDPRDHLRVFEVFERLQSGGSGSGLGLAVVKRIVDTHGGRVWVESAGVGKGCSFFVELPGIRAADREESSG